MSQARYQVGDVFERMAAIPDHTVDLIVTSPPFLALRSYLPADHPDKHLEIGSEATPAAFLTTLLALTREWRRILAPHGSLAVELGDTYSGSGGAGGDYLEGGLREGQSVFDGSASRTRRLHPDTDGRHSNSNPDRRELRYNRSDNGGIGWPQAKSLCLLPTLYPASLAYGRNLLQPDDVCEPWRVRNLIVWHRPNPPVGALGDKVRPSTSYITVACTAKDRWFDLDAERTAFKGPQRFINNVYEDRNRHEADQSARGGGLTVRMNTHAGAPPLDCWTDDEPDGDVWTIPTQPFRGAHYATFPIALPRKLINLMCPRQVCDDCGRPVVSSFYDSTELRGMRGVGREQMGDPVLFEDVRQQTHRQEPGKQSRMDTQREGLHLDAGTRPPDVIPRGVRNAASNGHGRDPGPFTDIERSGSPSQRGEGRQPTREPGSNDQIGSRQEAEASRLAHGTVPPLRQADSGAESCAYCGSGNLRRGRVLDPFAGSGTTLVAASELGRDSIGIDLDERNLDLARERIGMFLIEDEVSA